MRESKIVKPKANYKGTTDIGAQVDDIDIVLSERHPCRIRVLLIFGAGNLGARTT